MGVYRIRHVSETKYIQAVESESSRTYRTLLQAVEKPPLYAMPWWLDAVCGVHGWHAAIQYDDQQRALGMLPFYQTRIHGLSAITTPPFTQLMPLISLQSDTIVSLNDLLSRLPSTQILNITTRGSLAGHKAVTGRHISVRYSYIIPAEPSISLVRARYNEGLKRNLRAANDTYSIAESEDIGLFLELYIASHQQQGSSPPSWSDQVIRTVYTALIRHQSGQLTMVYHQQQPIAGVLIGWDQETSYYLAGGKVGGDHGASAHALLLDAAIAQAMEGGRSFDFEGSMHPGIANFFQSFGASPIPYWHIRQSRGVGKLWSLFRK
jgi:Acetyltransferase (GNAT) domain